MKRLTKRWSEQPYPNLAGKVVCEYKECDSTRSCEDCIHGQCKDRLASIEDILGDEYELDRLRELAQADKEGRVVILPFKTPGWGWSCRKGYPTAVEAYYPFPSFVMREIETGRYVGKTKEEAEDIFLKKMLRTEKV